MNRLTNHNAGCRNDVFWPPWRIRSPTFQAHMISYNLIYKAKKGMVI